MRFVSAGQALAKEVTKINGATAAITTNLNAVKKTADQAKTDLTTIETPKKIEVHRCCINRVSFLLSLCRSSHEQLVLETELRYVINEFIASDPQKCCSNKVWIDGKSQGKRTRRGIHAILLKADLSGVRLYLSIMCASKRLIFVNRLSVGESMTLTDLALNVINW